MKQKKIRNLKGFTLIELLAVIVILAVIALIAVPQVLKILNKSRLSAAEDSVYGIVKSAETYVSNFMLQNNGTLPSVELEFNCNGTSCDLTTTLDSTYNLDGLSTLEFKGNKPKSGKVIISDNGTNINTNDLVINGFVCGYLNGETICYRQGQYDVKENGSVIYFNPETNEQCSDYVETNSDTENKLGCMKWYVFNDNENSMAFNLLLDHNTTATIDNWNNRNTQLASDTSSWNSSLTPRLITTDEINTVTGKTEFIETSTSSWYYFDTLSQEIPTERNYGWLYDRTSDDCVMYGCVNNATGNNISNMRGYWTNNYVDLDRAWPVRRAGSLDDYNMINLQIGIRPVIAVEKSKIS